MMRLFVPVTVRFGEGHPAISPDGRWLAYASNRSGREEVWIRSYPNVDATPPLQVSKSGGTWPIWSRDGRELYFVEGDAVFSVPMTRGDRLGIGEPRVAVNTAMFYGPGALREMSIAGNYDVTHDGRVLLIHSDDIAEENHAVIVDGWFEELRRLAPTDD